MYKSLYEIISEMSGNLLSIGIDEKLALKIEKNSKIVQCDNLSSMNIKIDATGPRKRLKQIKIKKLKKIYNKKSIDYILCNYEHISKYLNTFVSDSIYLGNNEIYFYGDVDCDLVTKKYQRYDTKIEIKKYKDSKIVRINIKNAKNHFIKDKLYRVVDAISNVIELIGDVLMG